jgi:DNA processing protein
VSNHKLNQEEMIALLNLLSVDGIGSATVLRLVEQFGSLPAVFEASEARLHMVPRFSPQLIPLLKAIRPDGDVGCKQFEQAAEQHVALISFWDDDYPPQLRELESDTPALLFVRGTLHNNTDRLAVVGTRSTSQYGQRVTRDLVLGLQSSGLTIVSGLASGIDGFAHEAALEAHLPTEAVFGCGVDRIYPPQHTKLAQRILDAGGALISEYPLGTSPDRHHFPMRNRIIAGLTRGTLVVEAGDKSGALITANLAMEYNREVMAVPGLISAGKSAGCHGLIKAGAALIERAEDILLALNVGRTQPRAEAPQVPLPLEGPEADIARCLDSVEAQHIDAIAQRSGLAVGEALGQLLLLELKGAVKQLPGKYFVRA